MRANTLLVIFLGVLLLWLAITGKWSRLIRAYDALRGVYDQ